VYLLANAAAGPIWAKCSDIWGHKLALLVSVASFAVASMIAALSIDMRMLIAARAIQGTAGAGLTQLVPITISDLFSLRDRALYLGFMGLMWAVAESAGPLIGGALIEFVSWRWCFWINFLVCGLAFTLLVLFLDVHNPHTSLREGILAIDWVGTFSIVTVTLLILLGLEFGGSTFAWNSPKVICLIDRVVPLQRKTPCQIPVDAICCFQEQLQQCNVPRCYWAHYGLHRYRVLLTAILPKRRAKLASPQRSSNPSINGHRVNCGYPSRHCNPSHRPLQRNHLGRGGFHDARNRTLHSTSNTHGYCNNH
jgi:hypothetical protein